MNPFISMALPTFVLTDAYKPSHFKLYPRDVTYMSAYSEFRRAYDDDAVDQRIVFFGLRQKIENYVTKPWTQKDLEMADNFFATSMAGFKPSPFPRELFAKFIAENDGFFPVRIFSLPEGSVVHPHVPLYYVEASEEYAPLVTYLETLLTMTWYPSTVATLSRRTRDIIEAAFERSADEGAADPGLGLHLHDFGFRACTSVEQGVIGGAAHLLNFEGSDTVAATYYVQYYMNSGRPVGASVPASEHSVMTSWPSELAALRTVLAEYGDGVVSCVMDSYDYAHALEALLPVVKAQKLERGGVLVLRPDSGDPVETVLLALRAGERVFGATTNKKGYKMIVGCGVIQGDGLTIDTIADILDAAMANGYSAKNIVFGMGGGLLQKVNRDTMSFATKLSFIRHADGSHRDILKLPKSDASKCSLPGRLSVTRSADGKSLVVQPALDDGSREGELLKLVYDGLDREKRHCKWEDFDVVRKRVASEWALAPKIHDPISAELREKIAVVSKRIRDIAELSRKEN